jgi:UDP-N-acetylmuramoyl-tripeptide--D-alanyl-D-alanine ligase
MKLTLNDILKATGGQLIQSASRTVFDGIGIDTRTIREGEVFVAIKGTHFDGHDFVGEAVKKGTPILVVASPTPLPQGVSVIEVQDTVRALGDLASWWRAQWKAPCIAITGSNGKSTTKEMVAAIASVRGRVLKTEGNFNNLIGLPLTIFRWEKDHDIAVLEMGMNAKGEIRRLTQIARPEIGLITNITAAHLEKLHTVEGVAEAKGELFEAMAGRGVAVINDEDLWVKKLGARYGGPTISFGMQNTSDVQFRHMESTNLSGTDLTLSVLGQERTVRLPLPGTHNVMNAMAAVAVGVALAIDVDEMMVRLTEFHPMAMRFERVQLANGVCLVNDSYNANPQSMKAAFRTVGSTKRAGRFIAVLGDMLELGEQSGALHREVGKAAAEAGIEHLYLFGDFTHDVVKGVNGTGFNPSHIHEYRDIEALQKEIEKDIRAGDVVLVKGSRGMRMERIVEYLKHNIGCG